MVGWDVFRAFCQSGVLWECPKRGLTGVRISQLVQRPTEKPVVIRSLVRVPVVARDFSLRINFLHCPYSPRVQSHVSTSVCTLKIPNSGSHSMAWTHGYTAQHTLTRIGSAALTAALLYPGKETGISRKGQ